MFRFFLLLSIFLSTFSFLLTPTVIFATHCPQGPSAGHGIPGGFGAPGAQLPCPLTVNATGPDKGINPSTTIGGLVTNAVGIAFIVGALIVLFFLVWGAFQWITSGGDKDRLAGARKSIVNALIGLAILALAFLIVRVVGNILNIDILNLGNLPRLGPAASGAPCPSGSTPETRPFETIPTCS